MSARFSHQPDYNAQFSAVDLSELSPDMRRMLTVQFKEFIHHIEDTQADNELEHNPRVINFLERCLRDAA
jgi:hypothetical protein